MRRRQQAFLQPQLMLGNCRARAGNRTLELRLIGLRKGAELRHYELLDQLERPGVLFDCRLGMDPGHACGVENRTHLLQQPRQLVEACADVAQALGQGREVARHQQVHAVAGEVRVKEWVPAPFLQLLVRQIWYSSSLVSSCAST